MKTTLTTLLLIFSLCAFAQTPKKEASDKHSVTPNPVQIERLNSAYIEQDENQKKIKSLTELTIGYKLEEIDSLRFENGQFKFIIKPSVRGKK